MFKRYIDFEIAIRARGGGRYGVEVSGPGGDAAAALGLRPNDPTYRTLAVRLERLDADEDVLLALGCRLFRALFQGSVKEAYTRAQGTLEPGQGLRLRFNIAQEDLAV